MLQCCCTPILIIILWSLRDVTLKVPLRAAGPHCLASDAGPRRPAGTVGTQLSRAVTGLLPGGQ